MRPWEIIDRARAPDGAELVLARRGDEWAVRAKGRTLMSSRAHGSEERLAALALEAAARRRTVLVGGIGLGYTLRAALDRVPADARVIVAELVPALAAWVRGPVAALAGAPLEDARVRLQLGDVEARIAEATGAFDAILLDVDNGPSPLVHTGNRGLYHASGLAACHAALRPGGALGVWSAGVDEAFLGQLRRAGFEARQHVVAARGGAGGVRHAVFVGVKPARGARATDGGRGSPQRRG